MGAPGMTRLQHPTFPHVTQIVPAVEAMPWLLAGWIVPHVERLAVAVQLPNPPAELGDTDPA